MGISFEDGGAPAKLKKISDAARAASASFDMAYASVNKATTVVADFGNVAATASAGVFDLDKAMRATAASGPAAGAGADRAAAGFKHVADAANLATVAVARYNATAYGGVGARAASLALPGAAAGYAMPRAGVPGVTQSALAGRGAPLALAGASPALMRNVTPGGGGGSSSSRPMRTGNGGFGNWYGGGAAPPSGGGAGGSGGSGAGGGFPIGGGPGWLAHSAIHGAKLAIEVGAGYGVDSIYEAAKLQTILTSTQNIIGANAKQMEQIRHAAFEVGNRNAMSAVQTAEMFRDLSRQSAGAMPLSAMVSMLPQMAKMQVVLGAARGFSPHQTVDSVMALTHLFRQYDPKGQTKMFDTILRMGELMPDNLQRAVTSMTYFVPTLKNMHVKDEEAAALMVALSRFGMGKNKGGTSLQNLFMGALGPLQMTSHAQKGKASLLGPKNLNVIDEHGNSRFFTSTSGDPMGYLMALYKFAQKVGSVQFAKVMEGAYGKVGSRFGVLAGDPIIVDQLNRTYDAITKQRSLGLDSQSHTIFSTAGFAMSRSEKNFQSLATEVGGLALPGVTKGFTDLADAMHNAQFWLHQHAALEKSIQKAIVDGVVGVERYLVGHKKEFSEFGNDIMFLGKELAKAAPDVFRVADGIGRLYKQAKMFGDDFNNVYAAVTGSAKWAHDHVFGTVNPKAANPAMRGDAFIPDGAGGGVYASSPSSGLSAADISRLWIKNNGDPRAAAMMARVAFAESHGDPSLVNPNGGAAGLFQILPSAHGKGRWLDPTTNVREAISLFNQRRAHGGTGLEDWEDSRDKGAGGGWGRRQPAREVHHHHVVDIRGGTEHAKVQLRRAVREVFEEESRGSGDPRHHIARSGTIHTSAHSPNVHATPPPPR